MRVMTYNIRLGIQQGLEAVAAVIAEASPDLVVLQEVGCFWTMGPAGDTARELAELVGLSHAIYSPAIREARQGHDTPACYGHALLSRHPVRHHEQWFLPQLADEPRTALFSILETPHGALHVVSTHLSHRVTDRPAQAVFLVERMARLGALPGPLMLLGDLNEEPGVPWLRSLCETWADADADASRSTWPADEPRMRIDYLLAQGATWSDAVVLENADASDHRALMATLQWPG